MSNVDFNAILDTPLEEIKSKPPLPVGSYIAKISKLEPTKSSKKGTDGIEFILVPIEAKEDVDQEMLKEAGGVEGRSFKHTFWITPESAIMIKEFLVNHVGLEGTGRTTRQLLAEALNQMVGITLTHKMNEKGDRTYAQVSSTFKVE